MSKGSPEGSEKKLAKVTFTGKLAGEADAGSPGEEAALPIKMDIKDMKMEGVMYYDAEKRFFTISKSTSKVVMSMNNGETTMEIPSTQTQVTTLEKVEDL